MISFVEQLQLDHQHWDTVVIGAGVAAVIRDPKQPSRKKVLLVEASSFPREKVCGGCLNTRAKVYSLNLAFSMNFFRTKPSRCTLANPSE